MSRVKKYAKDWLVWIAAVSILVIAFILISYFIRTAGAFSDGPTNWGEFGSLLGAITGLIAFVGVLFTLRQNKLQSLDSEERSVFFDLLKLFISYRDELRVKRVEWKYDKDRCEWDITAFDDFCVPEETFRQIYIELYHTFYLEIRRTIPKNFTKDEFAKRIIPDKVSREQWAMTFSHLAIAIDNIYAEDAFATHGGVITTYPVHLNAYDYLCFDAIKAYFERNDLKPIAESCAKAADHCFAPYKDRLGTYFRNAYYILEMVSEFNSPKNYAKIFRAQLSKYELTALFFNSFGSQSNPKTRELYLNADLFNNLESKDVRLKEGQNDESVSRLQYMIFPPIPSKTEPKNEYVSRDLLRKLYDETR